MSKWLLMGALLLIKAFASGQSNVVKAVVINNDGDSIYGRPY